jgi:hypothetical protein
LQSTSVDSFFADEGCLKRITRDENDRDAHYRFQFTFKDWQIRRP